MQVIFSNHLRNYPPQEPEVYELKICKDNKPLPFDRVAEHQVEALLAASRGFFYKIPDQPISWGANTPMRFAAKKPFDCLYLSNVKGYVIIWWYVPRKLKVFFKIPIETFLKEKEQSTRKSLTMERAAEIGKAFIVKQ